MGANIAEGCGRGSNADSCPVPAHGDGLRLRIGVPLLLARDMRLPPQDVHERLQAVLSSLERMLDRLLAKIAADRCRPPKGLSADC
ncbi:MAG TPA: hypothetical protein VNF74_12965 [Terriglobales bacterium]|nr:hypothetical protein [Terriglobales bacterium]